MVLLLLALLSTERHNEKAEFGIQKEIKEKDLIKLHDDDDDDDDKDDDDKEDLYEIIAVIAIVIILGIVIGFIVYCYKQGRCKSCDSLCSLFKCKSRKAPQTPEMEYGEVMLKDGGSVLENLDTV